MSSIHGVHRLSQFLQSLSVKAKSRAVGASSTAGLVNAITGESSGSTAGQTVQGVGNDQGTSGGLFKKIEDAVTSALQTASASGSSDPNKTIEDAIAKVFKNNAAHPASTSSTAPDIDGDTDGANQTDTGASSKQAFLQTLQSFGINPQQFHQDFLAAIKDARGGQIDPSAALKSLPLGSAVDAIA